MNLNDSGISKKPRVLLAGIILMVLLALFSSFLINKLTPLLEKKLNNSATTQINYN